MARGLKLHYLKTILPIVRIAEESGINRGQIFKDADINAVDILNPHKTLTRSQELLIYKNIKANAKREDIALHIGRTILPHDLGALGYAQRACRTVKEVIELGQSYRDLGIGVIRWNFLVGKTEVIHRLFDQEDLGDLKVFLFELTMAMLHRYTQELVLKDAHPTSVKFSYDSPGYKNAYEEVFGATVQFGAEVTELRYPRSYFDVELSYSDPLLKSSMEQICQSMSSQLDSVLVLADEVKNILRDMEYSTPALCEMAEKLHISERSLRRHLQQQGTNYRAIVNEVRHERALHYLNDSDMPFQEISDRCGFVELSSFYAAFKRHEKLTPAEYRKKRNV